MKLHEAVKIDFMNLFNLLLIVKLRSVLVSGRVRVEVLDQQVAVAFSNVWNTTTQQVVHDVSTCYESLIKSINSGEGRVGLEEILRAKALSFCFDAAFVFS